MTQELVLDCGVLKCLFVLNELKALTSFYAKVRVPSKVMNEFLSEDLPLQEYKSRYYFFENSIQELDGFFDVCLEYSLDDILYYQGHIEWQNNIVQDGEVEAMAQCRSVMRNYPNVEAMIACDDFKARKFIETSTHKVTGTLGIIAKIALLRHGIEDGLSVYNQWVEILRKSKQKLRQDVVEAAWGQNVRNFNGGYL